MNMKHKFIIPVCWSVSLLPGLIRSDDSGRRGHAEGVTRDILYS